MDTEAKLLLWGIALGISALLEERNTDARDHNIGSMQNVLARAFAAAGDSTKEAIREETVADSGYDKIYEDESSYSLLSYVGSVVECFEEPES